MSYLIKTLDTSPGLLEDIFSNIGGQPGRDLTRQIIQRFTDVELPIKVKCHEYGMPWAWYRISLFVQNRAETVIISTKSGYGKNAAEGLHLQIRITNHRTFDKLDEFSQNIRSQIINGRECVYCPVGCKGSDCVFTYQGKEYVKCKNIGANFKFKSIEENDITSILTIVDMEMNKNAC